MILDNSQKVLGIELFAGAQAAWLRGEDGLSPATRAVYDRIRQAIPPVDQDVVMHPLMVQADELVKAHAISRGRRPSAENCSKFPPGRGLWAPSREAIKREDREEKHMMKLVECIPNFSVSRERDEAAFNALVETAQAVAGCTVLDVQSDGTHNRCVFTLVGSPEGIGEAAFRLAKRAMEVIDMTKHQGAHPRMGATDVIPFVPTMDMTVEECVELSRQVARRIWEELGIPSFLYEESATAPGRVNLAKIRKGQFEGMPEKLRQPEWAPDFGERKVHPTAGIIAIGARMPLVAFNVNLDTDNVEIAKSIAKAIRGSSGGFKFCKAIGLLLEDRNVAQVSMNMVNYEGTPLYYAYEMIRALADRWGVRIIGTELVGLTPAKALIDCAEYYLKLENFDCHKQVMEYHLVGME